MSRSSMPTNQSVSDLEAQSESISEYNATLDQMEIWFNNEEKKNKNKKYLIIIACVVFIALCIVSVIIGVAHHGHGSSTDLQNNEYPAIDPPEEIIKTLSPIDDPSNIPSGTPQTHNPSDIPLGSSLTNNPSGTPQTDTPSENPSKSTQTEHPSDLPTKQTTDNPSNSAKTVYPSDIQSPSPQSQTGNPSENPSGSPQTVHPSNSPQTGNPSDLPSVSPKTEHPSDSPQDLPSDSPQSGSPSDSPSHYPSNTPQTNSPSTNPLNHNIIKTQASMRQSRQCIGTNEPDFQPLGGQLLLIVVMGYCDKWSYDPQTKQIKNDFYYSKYDSGCLYVDERLMMIGSASCSNNDDTQKWVISGDTIKSVKNGKCMQVIEKNALLPYFPKIAVKNCDNSNIDQKWIFN